MNEQLTLQSTQYEETKTVPLRRRKACLAGAFALFAACALVLLIPHPAYAGIIGDLHSRSSKGRVGRTHFHTEKTHEERPQVAAERKE